jgi:acyl-CoA hydrolase
MEVIPFITHRLVKGEDLNHHGTLYAGRSAEWFVESGFTAAASLTRPERIVCLQIHGMIFSRPVHLGDIVRFESKIVLTGKSRLVAYVKMEVENQKVVEGFITFVNVDPEAKPVPHGIVIHPSSEEDMQLQERARNLRR